MTVLRPPLSLSEISVEQKELGMALWRLSWLKPTPPDSQWELSALRTDLLHSRHSFICAKAFWYWIQALCS